MWFRGQDDIDVIACCHDSASQNNTHYSDPSTRFSVLVTARDRFFQATLELIELSARIAEPGDLNSRVAANVQNRTSRESQQVYAGRRNVFAHVGGGDIKPSCLKFLNQFVMYQVNLTQVRLRRVCPDSRAVLHRDASMGITLHAFALDQA